VRITIQR